LGLSEVWGTHARVDPLTGYFTQKIVECNLLDIEPVKLKPTWRNNRVGEDSIAKRLDRFLLTDSFLENLVHLKQWIGFGGISDHFPIFLELRQGSSKPPSPFKFNRTWLTDDSFINLVRENWIPFLQESTLSTASHFIENLKRIKAKTKTWAFQKRQAEELELKNMETQLKQFQRKKGVDMLL
jgi:hypothetical protein